MCETHYRRWKKTGSTESTRIDPLTHYETDGARCWIWSGALWPNGYGKTSVPVHGTRLAHRVLYIEHVGAIAEGLDLDHLCRVRRCVNPDHLQPVSRAENLARGHAARTTCESGLHDITVPGSVKPGTKQCIECWRTRYRTAGAIYRAKRR